MTVSQALLKKAERIQRLVQNGSVDEDPQAWMAGVHVAELAESIIPMYYPIADAATRAQVMRQAAALMYGVAETEQETLAVLLDRDAAQTVGDVMMRRPLVQKEMTRAEKLSFQALSEISGLDRRLLTNTDLQHFMATKTGDIMCRVYATAEGVSTEELLDVVKHPLALFESEAVRKAYRAVRGIVGGTAMNKSADEFLADWDETIQDVVVKRRLTADERREEMRIAMQMRNMWEKRKAELNDKSDIVWPEAVQKVSPDAEIREFENGQFDKLRVENAILRARAAAVDGQVTTLQGNLGTARQSMRQAKRDLAEERQISAKEKQLASRLEEEVAALEEQIADLERSLHARKKSANIKHKQEMAAKAREIEALEKKLAEARAVLTHEKRRALQLKKETAILQGKVADLDRSLQIQKKNARTYRRNQAKTATQATTVLEKQLAEAQAALAAKTIENEKLADDLDTTRKILARTAALVDLGMVRAKAPAALDGQATETEAPKTYAETVAAQRRQAEAEREKQAAEEQAALSFVMPSELIPFYNRYHQVVALVGGYQESVYEKYNQYKFTTYWYKPLTQVADEQIPNATKEERINWITNQVDRLADAGAERDLETSPAAAEMLKDKTIGAIIIHYHGEMKKNGLRKLLLPLFLIAGLVGATGYGISKMVAGKEQEPVAGTPVPTAVTNTVAQVAAPVAETDVPAVEKAEKVKTDTPVEGKKPSEAGSLINMTFNFYGAPAVTNTAMGQTPVAEKKDTVEKKQKPADRALAIRALPNSGAKLIFSDDLAFGIIGNAQLKPRVAARLVRNTAAQGMAMLLRDGLSVEQAGREFIARQNEMVRGPRITLHNMRGSVVAQFSVNNARDFLQFANGVVSNLTENLRGLPADQAALFLDAFGGTLSYPQQQLEQMRAAAPREQITALATVLATQTREGLKTDSALSDTEAALNAVKAIRADYPSATYLPLVYTDMVRSQPQKVATQVMPVPQKAPAERER